MDQSQEVVKPIDFFDLKSDRSRSQSRRPQRKLTQQRAVFVTGTDTGVGKTVATCVLGTLLKQRGLDVGVMKPVQCGGNDARFLKDFLNVIDPLKEINPYHAREPLSPHLAFQRQRMAVNVDRIIATYQRLKNNHDWLLVEGAGGLMVPIKGQYLMADLIRDLDLELVIVARPGLGSINHSLLTIEQARARGISVKGIIFCEAEETKPGLAEETNPDAIHRFGQVPVLGRIAHLKEIRPDAIMRTCKSTIHLGLLLNDRAQVNARQLKAWDKEYLWHPFTQMRDWLREEHLVIDEANGCYLKDTEGRKYLDGVSSLWVNVHGHRHKHIDQALRAQMDKLSHSTLLGLSNTPAVLLARKLVNITPRTLKKVFYSDNGSTAVEVAIKMAYQYWQNTGRKKKTRIAHLSHSYHGDTLGSVSVGGIELFHKVYDKLIFKTLGLDFPDCYRVPKGKTYPDYAFECVDKLEGVLKREHRTVAALVIEPLVQGAAGIIVWPDGVLKRIAGVCQKYDVLLIADEVATGFGRTGKMFACNHENVSPDFLCLAKGLTGGYLPLAATLTTERIFKGFLFDYRDQKTFFHGHTYTGNPLGCAAAMASLQVFEKEQTLRRIQPKIKHLSDKLKMFYNLRNVGDVRQKGLMAGIELVRNKRTQEPYLWKDRMGARVCQEVRKNGVILRPLGNVIVLMPPLAVSKRDLDDLLNATYKAIERVTQYSRWRP